MDICGYYIYGYMERVRWRVQPSDKVQAGSKFKWSLDWSTNALAKVFSREVILCWPTKKYKSFTSEENLSRFQLFAALIDGNGNAKLTFTFTFNSKLLRNLNTVSKEARFEWIFWWGRGGGLKEEMKSDLSHLKPSLAFTLQSAHDSSLRERM